MRVNRPHPTRTTAPRHRRGSVLIEGLLAIIVFSTGLVALLLLLSAALRESGNAQYRSEASLLAADLIARMWTGERSLPALQSRFGRADSSEYQAWLARVQATLPGVSASRNMPQLAIATDRSVTLTLRWQPPGDADAHQLVVHTVVTD